VDFLIVLRGNPNPFRASDAPLGQARIWATWVTSPVGEMTGSQPKPAFLSHWRSPRLCRIDITPTTAQSAKLGGLPFRGRLCVCKPIRVRRRPLTGAKRIDSIHCYRAAHRNVAGRGRSDDRSQRNARVGQEVAGTHRIVTTRVRASAPRMRPARTSSRNESHISLVAGVPQDQPAEGVKGYGCGLFRVRDSFLYLGEMRPRPARRVPDVAAPA